MASKYDEDGNYIGTIVENLTDGPIPGNINSKPYGTLGDVSPSPAIDPMQASIWNLKPHYGVRTVWHKVFGTVEQALVNSFDELVWINI